MNSIVSGAISSDPVLAERVRRANRILEEAIGSAAGHVKPEWSLANDSYNRSILLLALTDFITAARVEARFAPDELDNESHLFARFYRIWGDLLQSRSHRQLDQLSG